MGWLLQWVSRPRVKRENTIRRCERSLKSGAPQLQKFTVGRPAFYFAGRGSSGFWYCSITSHLTPRVCGDVRVLTQKTQNKLGNKTLSWKLVDDRKLKEKKKFI